MNRRSMIKHATLGASGALIATGEAVARSRFQDCSHPGSETGLEIQNRSYQRG